MVVGVTDQPCSILAKPWKKKDTCKSSLHLYFQIDWTVHNMYINNYITKMEVGSQPLDWLTPPWLERRHYPAWATMRKRNIQAPVTRWRKNHREGKEEENWLKKPWGMNNTAWRKTQQATESCEHCNTLPGKHMFTNRWLLVLKMLKNNTFFTSLWE